MKNKWKQWGACCAILLFCNGLPAADTVFPPLSADKPDTEWWAELQAMGRDETLQRFNQLLETLITRVKAENDAILLDHFQSMKAMMQQEQVLTLPPEEGMPSWPRETWVRDFARRFLFTYMLPGDTDNSKAIAFARNWGHWFHAFTSRYDSRMAYCWVVAPRGYWEKQHEKGVAYPLVVDLHGSQGNRAPVWASWQMSDTPPERKDPGSAQHRPCPEYEYFQIIPWMGYFRIMADAELWQELDWVQAVFPIDPDRRCLTGGSLGGSATWHFGSRTPGYWAAVVPNVGTWGEEFMFPWLQENLKDVPVLFHNGERDPNVRHPYAVYKAMKDLHANVQLLLNPYEGHHETETEIAAWYRFMLSQKRERPKQFTFTADSPWYPGRTGIEMYWDPAMSARPKFTCRIDGQEVHIDSEGTPGMFVDLGPEGLGMQGEVSVFWNGNLMEKKTVVPEKPKSLDPVKDCWAGSIYVKPSATAPTYPIDDHSRPASRFQIGANVVKLGQGGGGSVWAWSIMRHERQ